MSLAQNWREGQVYVWGGTTPVRVCGVWQRLCSSFRWRTVLKDSQVQIPGKLTSATKASVSLNGCDSSTLWMDMPRWAESSPRSKPTFATSSWPPKQPLEAPVPHHCIRGTWAAGVDEASASFCSSVNPALGRGACTLTSTYLPAPRAVSCHLCTHEKGHACPSCKAEHTFISDKCSLAQAGRYSVHTHGPLSPHPPAGP